MNTPEKISEDVLAEQWHSLQLKAWQKLRAAVKGSKLDQKEIAFRIGMDEGRLSRILKGRSNVTMRNMHEIARGIGHRLEVEIMDLNTLRAANGGYSEVHESAPQVATASSIGLAPGSLLTTGSSARAVRLSEYA